MSLLAFLIALATALVVLLVHVALWRQPWRLDPPWSYVVGVLILTLGFTAWDMSGDTTDPAVALWAIVILSGLGDGLAYWVRWRLAEHDARALRAGQVAGPPEEIGDGAAHEGVRATD